jgi:hypothetical protein
MSHAKPLGYYRCRACKTVWKGEQLYQDPQSSVLKWTCGDLFCVGAVDGIPPDEIVATLNAAQPGKPDGAGEEDRLRTAAQEWIAYYDRHGAREFNRRFGTKEVHGDEFVKFLREFLVGDPSESPDAGN